MPSDVDAVSIGVWWRVIPTRSATDTGQPVYKNPRPGESRWQRGWIIDALYLADTKETVWAEWYRLLAERNFAPADVLPVALWRWTVSLERVADLSDKRRLARVGLPLPVPGRATWPRFQAVGESLYREGWVALMAPSAARPDDGRTLCIFRPDASVSGATPDSGEVITSAPVPPRGMRT
jgi:hypothetical protein